MKRIAQVRRAALDLIYIHRFRCSACGVELDAGVSTSDTDMVPFYLGSVCAVGTPLLVIAELTAEEFDHGCRQSMPRRAEKHVPGRTFVYVDYRRKCPLCGGALAERDVLPLRAYRNKNPNVCLLCFDAQGQEVLAPLAEDMDERGE